MKRCPSSFHRGPSGKRCVKPTGTFSDIALDHAVESGNRQPIAWLPRGAHLAPRQSALGDSLDELVSRLISSCRETLRVFRQERVLRRSRRISLNWAEPSFSSEGNGFASSAARSPLRNGEGYWRCYWLRHGRREAVSTRLRLRSDERARSGNSFPKPFPREKSERA